MKRGYPFVKKGERLLILNQTLFKEDISRMKNGSRGVAWFETDEDKRRREKTISDPLRRYYFGVVMPCMAEETGHSSDFIHGQMKEIILGASTDRFGFKILPSVFSNDSEMPVHQKKAFVDEVRRWAADFLNLWIPEPETVIF